MSPRPIYQELASLVGAIQRCQDDPSNASWAEWSEKHQARVESLVGNHLPHGSGFDNGTALDLGKSTAERLVFTTAFHHMNDVGMYDGWTEHTVTVRPSLVFGFTLTVSGRNRNDIKELISQVFHDDLHRLVDKDGKAVER